jgi:uncharacterized membrane protein (UPF0127 family)
VRFATEEILRRGNSNLGDDLTSDTKLADALFADHEKFIDTTFAKREKEIVALHTVKPEDVADTFKKYDEKVLELKKKFGYSADDEMQEGNKQEVVA